MRRTVVRLTVAALCLVVSAPCLAPKVHAQGGEQPQSFFYGAWTGGLFPPPSVLTARRCLAEPTVIFTRGLVLRATYTDEFYIQRLIASARGTGNGVDIQFAPTEAASPTPALPGFTPDHPGGFGCAGPDELRVQRISPNEIRFPGCHDFPFPLVRCPAG